MTSKLIFGVSVVFILFLTVTCNCQPKSYWDDELCQGAFIGDYLRVLSALNNGAEVDHTASTGQNSLMLASERGLIDICILLVDSGANVNAQSGEGFSVIMFAASSDKKYDAGTAEVCQLLLLKGADVNHIDKRGHTPLGCAITARKGMTADILLQYGADINFKDAAGMNYLHLCADNDILNNVLNILLNKGLDINSQDKGGVTPLIRAANFGQLENCKLLVFKGADINIKSSSFGTALQAAQKKGYKNVVNFLQNEVNTKILTLEHVPAQDKIFQSNCEQAYQYFNSRQWFQALKVFWRLTYPDDSFAEKMGKREIIKKNLMNTYFNMGVDQLQSGNPTLAKASFQDLIKNAPDDKQGKELLSLADKYTNKPLDNKYKNYVKVLNFRPFEK